MGYIANSHTDQLPDGLLAQLIAELWRPEGPPNGAPYLLCERKGNPWVDFLMVIMASGVDRGRVLTTTTTAELPNMAANPPKKKTALV